MSRKSRLARIDLLVDPDANEEYRVIIFSQGENASSDYRRYQRQVIDNYQKSKDSVESNPKVHISPREINETLDKWLIDAKRRSEDGSIEELKGLSKKSQHYTNVVNSYLFTQQQKIEQEKKNKALLQSTNTNKELEELKEKVRQYEEKERQRKESQEETTTITN